MSPTARSTKGLDLAVVGNSRIGALIDTDASVVWMCVPRFDGDPVFCSLQASTSNGPPAQRRACIRAIQIKNSGLFG
jgi:GH15 family glucan-1,4-alpha-glucosidase